MISCFFKLIECAGVREINVRERMANYFEFPANTSFPHHRPCGKVDVLLAGPALTSPFGQGSKVLVLVPFL